MFSACIFYSKPPVIPPGGLCAMKLALFFASTALSRTAQSVLRYFLISSQNIAKYTFQMMFGSKSHALRFLFCVSNELERSSSAHAHPFFFDVNRVLHHKRRKDHTVQFHVLFVSYAFALSHALLKRYFSFFLILSSILWFNLKKYAKVFYALSKTIFCLPHLTNKRSFTILLS